MLFLIILILTFASGYFLPWWVVAIAAFLSALIIGKTSRQAFWSGFLAVFIVWMVLALFKSVPNDHILATKIAHLFNLPGWGYILVITGIVGGLVAGFAALSGVLLKKAFDKH